MSAATSRKFLLLPLFLPPLSRGRGLRVLTQKLRGQARDRLLHLRLLPLLLSLLVQLLLLFLPRQPPPLSPPHPLHLFQRLESHFQEEVNRGVVDGVATSQRRPSEERSTSGSHETDRGCSHSRGAGRFPAAVFWPCRAPSPAVTSCSRSGGGQLPLPSRRFAAHGATEPASVAAAVSPRLRSHEHHSTWHPLVSKRYWSPQSRGNQFEQKTTGGGGGGADMT